MAAANQPKTLRVSQTIVIKAPNSEPGAFRSLSLQDGATIHEQLLALSDQGDTAIVNWVGRFKRRNSADNPPDDQTDDAARKVVTGIYSSGLANLKKQVEH